MPQYTRALQPLPHTMLNPILTKPRPSLGSHSLSFLPAFLLCTSISRSMAPLGLRNGPLARTSATRAPLLFIGAVVLAIAAAIGLSEAHPDSDPAGGLNFPGIGGSGPGGLVPGGGGSGPGGLVPGGGGSGPGGSVPGGGGSGPGGLVPGGGGGLGGSGPGGLVPGGGGRGKDCARTCEWWESNDSQVASLTSGASTLAQVFGTSAVPVFGSGLTLIDALQDKADDGFRQLARQGTASYLNSLSAGSGSGSFHYTTRQVVSHFAAALASKEAAVKQSADFANANFEFKIPHCL